MTNKRTRQPDTWGNGESRIDYNLPDRRPWFGPKHFGYGYAPQTWQGYLITAATVLGVVLISTLVHDRSLKMLAVAPVIALVTVIRLILWRQVRR